MAVGVVSSREGAPGVTQETLLLILDWVEVSKGSALAGAAPTLTQPLPQSPEAPAGD